MDRRVRAIALAIAVCVSTLALVLPSAGAHGTGSAPAVRVAAAGAPLHAHAPASAANSRLAAPLPLSRASLGPHPALPGTVTVIRPDGTLGGASAPITINGNTYTITAKFTGGIFDERNGSTINGGNNILNMSSGLLWAIEVWNATSVTITDINFTNASVGVEVVQSSGVSVTSCHFGSIYEPLFTYFASSVTFDNNFAPFTEGIYADYTNGLTAENNNLSYAYAVVYGEDSSNFVIIHNNGYHSSYGVYLEYGATATVFGNNLSSSSYGIYGYFFAGIHADWNNMSFDSDGFYLEYGSGLWGSNNGGQNNSYVIYLYEYSDVALSHEHAPGSSSYGIYAEYSANLTFTSWDISWGDYAAYIEYGGHVILTAVNANHTYDGFDLEDISGLWVTGVSAGHIRGVGYEGLYTYADWNAWVNSSWFAYDSYGIEDDSSQAIWYWQDNMSFAPSKDYGAYIYDDGLVQFSQCQFFNDSGYGLYADYTNGLTVLGNDMPWAGYYAMYIEYATHVVVTGNDVRHAWEEGIYLYEVTNPTVSNNIGGFSGYKYSYGLDLEDLAGGMIWNNSFPSTNYSIYVYESAGTQVWDNNGSNSYYGLYLEYNTNCSFVGNQLYHDTNAFYIDWNAGVKIYHNNFVSDGGWQISASLSTIRWDNGYPSGGNFWSNDTSPDTMSGAGQNVAGADGIVDHAFKINASNIDNYPLAHTWGAPTVAFSETGLSAGTTWWVTVGGMTWSSATSTLMFPVPDASTTASYGYTVPKVNGYNAASPASGTITSTNGPVTIAFTPSSFTVTFTETGLASGASWTVTLDGKAISGTAGSAITGTVTNGSHHFTVSAVTNYAITQNASGGFSVSGSAPSLVVAFVQTASGSTGNNGKTNSNNGNSYSNPLVYALIGLLILFILLTLIGFMRGRGKGPAPAATAWTPPAGGSGPSSGGPGGSSPPPGATGGGGSPPSS